MCITLDNLSPYERYQLERWGNILNNADPLEEFSGPDEREIKTAEEAFIFNNENNPNADKN